MNTGCWKKVLKYLKGIYQKAPTVSDIFFTISVLHTLRMHVNKSSNLKHAKQVSFE